jgi:hypothetical protein
MAESAQSHSGGYSHFHQRRRLGELPIPAHAKKMIDRNHNAAACQYVTFVATRPNWSTRMLFQRSWIIQLKKKNAPIPPPRMTPRRNFTANPLSVR